MRPIWFLACILGLCGAAFSGLDLQAGCRCNRGARKQARQERRACKRGNSVAVQQPSNYVSPYPDQVTPVGAAAAKPVEWRVGEGIGARGLDAKGNRYVVTHHWFTTTGKEFEQRCCGTFCYQVEIKPKPAQSPPVTPPEPPAPTIEPSTSDQAWHRADQPTATETLGQSDQLAPAFEPDEPRLVTEHLNSDPPEAP